MNASVTIKYWRDSLDNFGKARVTIQSMLVQEWAPFIVTYGLETNDWSCPQSITLLYLLIAVIVTVLRGIVHTRDLPTKGRPRKKKPLAGLCSVWSYNEKKQVQLWKALDVS